MRLIFSTLKRLLQEALLSLRSNGPKMIRLYPLDNPGRGPATKLNPLMCNGQDSTGHPLHQNIISADKKDS
jgi:hypothetical protein